jgi:hypothetical protein
MLVLHNTQRCLVLAKSRRQRAPSITTGLHPKTDMKIPMSAFLAITSGVGGKAAVDQGWRLRPLMTLSGRGGRTLASDLALKVRYGI